jgi:two-component system, chemotaxis family, protein-glutamate methylesterase/glutaminase
VKSPHLVVIGCSLGGMKALEKVLSALPKDFQTPIAVTQHRHRASNEGLPAFFRRVTELRVVDVDDKQWIKPNCIYFAPANYHLLIDKGEFNLSIDAAVAYSRPSVDVMFESAADAYGDRLIAVVLTGANNDGARGSARVKKKGGFVIAQDPKTAEAPEMPQAAIDTGAVDRILPLERIGPYLVELCQTSGSVAKAGHP